MEHSFLEKLTDSQLVKNFTALFGNGKFLTTLTRACDSSVF